MSGEISAVDANLPDTEICFRERGAGRCHFYFPFWRLALIFGLPGVLNLAPLLLVRGADVYDRVEAIAAGVWGAVRMAAPVLTLVIWLETLSEGGFWVRVTVGGTSDPSLELLITAWTASLIVWTFALLAWLSFDAILERLPIRVRREP